MPLELYIGRCKTREAIFNNKAIAEAVGFKFGDAKKALPSKRYSYIIYRW